MKKLNLTFKFLKGLMGLGLMLSFVQCLSTSNETGSDPGNDPGDTPTETISPLPEGVALSAILAGETIEVTDEDMIVVGGEANDNNNNQVVDNEDLPLRIFLKGNDASSTIAITLYLTIDDITSSLSIDTLYTLNNAADLGQVVLTPTSGSATTFTITSASIIFTVLEVAYSGNVAGSLQLAFDNAGNVLTANFNGEFIFPPDF